MPNYSRQEETGQRAAPRARQPRRPISCLPCRHRKLRCDRGLPACANCVHRDEITECTYVPRRTDARASSRALAEPQEPLDLSKAAQLKIDRMEQMIRMLVKTQQSNQEQTGSLSSSDDAGHDQNGIQQYRRVVDTARTSPERIVDVSIKIDAAHKQCRSLDEAHWALLLGEIGDVRKYLSAQEERYEQQKKVISQTKRELPDESGPTLLFGSSRKVGKTEILAQLPSKFHSDMFVARFFAHLYPAVYVIHEPTFYMQYEAFWTDKSKTSMVWVALLFAILRVAMLDYIREGDELPEIKDKCQDLANNYRNSFTDCLILADYTQPHEFLIEALCYHLYAEYVSTRDAKSSIWVLCGMILRMAMRMGYHQPSQPTLASRPFQIEMRKRVWTFLRQADVMFSFQSGLPSMIGSQLLRGPLPRNFHDDESFFDGCATLPSALPDREYTRISFLIAKSKLTFGFARALEEINRPGTLKWERVLEIDRDMRRIYDEVPDNYKLGPFSGHDSFILVSARFVLAGIFHKSLCVIHSRFLENAKSDSRCLYSRRTCLSSALSILGFQVIQNQDIPVDGGVRSLTNYQTSFTLHHYLLAATIISAYLCSEVRAGNPLNDNASSSLPTRAVMIKALDDSAQIFGQMKDASMEAYKAADVLGMLVKKFQAMEPNKSSNGRKQTSTPREQPYWSEGTPSESRADTEGLDRGYSHNFPHDTVESVQSPGSAQLDMQEPGPLLFQDSYAQGGFSNQIVPREFSLRDPNLGFGASALLPCAEDANNGANYTIENHSVFNGDVGQFSYPTPLSLSDPMTSLWNLNTWTQGGFT